MLSPGSTVSKFLSDDEYLELERKTGLKYELFDGEAFPMPPASFNHRIIVANLNRHLGKSLKGRCNVGGTDLRLKVDATGLLTYPDLFVTRGDLAMVDPGATLVNPSLLAEVCSPATELYDRTIRFEHYRQIPTLSTYLVISQNAPRVEQFHRETDVKWLHLCAFGPHSTMELPALKVTLFLADIYSGVEFPDLGSFLRPIRR